MTEPFNINQYTFAGREWWQANVAGSLSYTSLGSALANLPSSEWENASGWLKKQSGREHHASDCGTSTAPAHCPAPCTCGDVLP